MGLFSKIFYGVDLDEEQRKQDELDAKLRELNERDYGPGGRLYEKITASGGIQEANQTLDQVLENLETSRAGDVSDQVNDAFGEGLQEGYDNVTGAISNTLAAPIRFTFASIPWQLWALALVALFLYAGGGLWLKGILNRR